MTREEYETKRAKLQAHYDAAIRADDWSGYTTWRYEIEKLDDVWSEILLAEESANRESLIRNHEQCIKLLKEIVEYDDYNRDKYGAIHRECVSRDMKAYYTKLTEEYERLRK